MLYTWQFYCSLHARLGSRCSCCYFYDVSEVVLTFTPRNSQPIIYIASFLRGGFRRRCTIPCSQDIPPTRKAAGRGQCRQSARKTAAPAKKSPKTILWTPCSKCGVDSLDNQDAMDTLVNKLVDKFGPRTKALVDRKLQQHAGQLFSASPAHSQCSGWVTVVYLTAAVTLSLGQNQLTPPQDRTLQPRTQLLWRHLSLHSHFNHLASFFLLQQIQGPLLQGMSLHHM